MKIHHVLIILAGSSSVPLWSKACFPADTHMANRECGPPTPTSPCDDREGGRERDGLSFHYSADYYRPRTAKCIRVSYSLFTLYIFSFYASVYSQLYKKYVYSIVGNTKNLYAYEYLDSLPTAHTHTHTRALKHTKKHTHTHTHTYIYIYIYIYSRRRVCW